MQFNSGPKLFAILLLGLPLMVGCTSAWFLKKDVDPSESRREKIRQRLAEAALPIPIHEVATPRQMTLGALENIGLVTHLSDTGGPVKPSQQREKLIEFMRKNDVPEPNALLDSKKTAMVAALAAVPPAARKGDRVNVSIKLSNFAEASDLRQGWLRETSLVEMGNLGGKIRESFERAKAEGSLVTLAQYSGRQDPAAKVEAVVVGGARLLRGRDLGLGIRSDFADALTMAAVLPAINARFTYFDGSKQQGVATPLSDDYIELEIPPRYQADPYHYINVVQHIHFKETTEQLATRLTQLAEQLQSPETARDASWALEAIGEPAKETLVAGLQHADTEVRFYCAHSLAYLGDRRAVPTLTELATDNEIFRAQCLNAMASMESYQAEEALKSLLSLGEPETRYGAVRALRRRNPRDPLILGSESPRVGSLLEIPSSGQDFVAVSMVDVPEIVFFGQVPQLQIKAFYNVNPSLLIQPSGSNEVTISRFLPGSDDMIVVCNADLRSVLEGIAQVGGGYGDWVSFVRECQENQLIETLVVMNPIPDQGRAFEESQAAKATAERADSEVETASLPPETTQEGSWYKPWSWWD